MGAKEKVVIISGFEIAALDPKDPAAICLDCPATKRPHLNQDCKGKRTGGLAMAAVQDTGTTGKGSSSSNGGSSGTLDMNTMAMMFHQAVAMAAAGAAPVGLGQGLPRAYNKPENFKGGRGYGGNGNRQYQGAPPGLSIGAAAMACLICGFAKGHGGGICYLDKPEGASEKWEGPTERTPEQGLVHYLNRCMQQKLKPRLGRCKGLLQRLVQSGKLPPPMVQFIGQHTQQQQPQRYMNMAYGMAPEQAAYAAYLDRMGMSGYSNWPVGYPAMSQQMAGLLYPNTPLTIAGAHTPNAGSSGTGDQAAMMVVPDATSYMGFEQHQEEKSHFGPSFCYVGYVDWRQEPAARLDGSSMGQEFALIGTRAQAGAGAAPVSRVVRQPVPKGFSPPSTLPTDLNAMRQMPRVVVVGNPGGGVNRRLISALLDIERLVVSKISAVRAGLEGVGGEDGNSASMMGQQPLQEAAAAKGTASTVPGSTAGHCGPIAAAAATSRDLLTTVMLRYGFTPVVMDYRLRQSMPVSLDFLVSTTKQQGLTLTTTDGRDVLMDATFNDLGATLLLFTEVVCGEWGVHIFRTTQVPPVKGIDGLPSKKIIGRTGPLVLTLAKGHPLAAALPVPCAWVLEGDAGGMFKVCLDKKTLLPVFGYVDPAINMLCYRPKAAQGRMDIIHGIPVRGHVKTGGGGNSSNMAAVSVTSADSEAGPDYEHIANDWQVPAVQRYTVDEINQMLAEVNELRQSGHIKALGPIDTRDWNAWLAAQQPPQEVTGTSRSVDLRYLNTWLIGGVQQEVQEDNSSSSSLPDQEDIPTFQEAAVNEGFANMDGKIEEISPHGSAADAWKEHQTGEARKTRRGRRGRGRGRKGKGHQPEQQQEGEQQPAEEPAGKPWGFDWSSIAGRLLPGVSWFTAQMVMLVLGVFHFFLDLPLREYPSKLMRGLVDMACAAVRPSIGATEVETFHVATECTPGYNGNTRYARKRRRNRKPKARHGRQPEVHQDTQQASISMVATVRHSGKVITARTVLLGMLCFFCTLCTSAAMQVTSNIGAAATGSALQHEYYPLPHGVPPQMNMHLLQQELASLHCSRFRCYSRA
jgi:hypothetical protein